MAQATITDGTTSVSFEDCDEAPDLALDKSVNVSASGSIKTQTSGKRPVLRVRVAASFEDLADLMELLTNGADDYYYTPKRDFSALFPRLAPPWAVNVRDIRLATPLQDSAYLEFVAESVEYA